MTKVLTYNEIDQQQWQALVNQSPTATWFQTPEAYQFYASLPNEMIPFVVGVCEVKDYRLKVKGKENGKAETIAYNLSPITYHLTSAPANCQSPIARLKGVCVGYITKEKNSIKQFFTRRAIIIGGPLLAEDASNEEVEILLKAVTNANRQSPIANRPIYIETRNFHDYSKWKVLFDKCGFKYVPHLNFQINTTSEEIAKANIGKHRWKYIRLSIRDGATMVDNPTIEQVRECYDLLVDLYTKKVKTPLFSWDFFEKLYYQPNARYLLVELEGKIIGGTVCVCLPNKAMYEWFVCGNDRYRKGIRPSSVATWYGMQYAASNKYPLFDLMGAGKPDEPYGVRDFKAEFGGELVEHGRFLYVRKLLLYRIGKMGVKMLKAIL